MKKKYTIQHILFKTFEAEDLDDACEQWSLTPDSEFEIDEGSVRGYEGEYDFTTYQKEKPEDTISWID